MMMTDNKHPHDKNVGEDTMSLLKKAAASLEAETVPEQVRRALIRIKPLVNSVLEPPSEVIDVIAARLCGANEGMAVRRVARAALLHAPHVAAANGVANTLGGLLGGPSDGPLSLPPLALRAVVMLCLERFPAGLDAVTRHRVAVVTSLLQTVTAATPDSGGRGNYGDGVGVVGGGGSGSGGGGGDGGGCVSTTDDDVVAACEALQLVAQGVEFHLEDDAERAHLASATQALLHLLEHDVREATKPAAAAALVSFGVVLTPPESAVPLLRWLVSSSRDNHPPPPPPVCEELCIQLGKTTLSSSAKVCVCLAIVCSPGARALIAADTVGCVATTAVLPFLVERLQFGDEHGRHESLLALAQLGGFCAAHPSACFGAENAPARHEVAATLLGIVRSHWDVGDKSRHAVAVLFRASIQCKEDYERVRNSQHALTLVRAGEVLPEGIARVASDLVATAERAVRGALHCLQELAALVGGASLIKTVPHLPETMLRLLTSSAPPTAKAASIVIEELARGCSADEASVWVQPLVRVLCRLDDSESRRRVGEMLLPRLQECAPLLWSELWRALRALRAGHSDGGGGDAAAAPDSTEPGAAGSSEASDATVVLLMLSKAAGHRGGVDLGFDLHAWTAVVLHVRPDVRCDAFSCLCETGTLDHVRLEAVRMFLEHNLAAQGTRFRRVIIRSAGRLLRKAAKSKSSLVETEFCNWLWSFLFESLGPGLGGRRALALALIGVAIDAGVPRACGRDGTATFNDTETMALFCCFGDANEANRLAAAELLCTHGRESVCGLSKADLHGLVEHSKRMCNSLEIADASFGSLVQRVVAKHCGDLLSEAHDNVTAALVSELQRRVAIARVSLVDSLRVAPLYPVLQTLRYVVVDARVPDGDVQSIVAALFEVAEVMFPAVGQGMTCAVEPSFMQQLATEEGMDVPAPDATSASTSGQQANGEDNDPPSRTTLRRVLLSSWRAIKEVGLILEHLYGRDSAVVNADKDADDSSVLQLQRMREDGAQLVQLLCRARHCGVVDALQAVLTTLCRRLMAHRSRADTTARAICVEWAETGFELLLASSADSTIRRSAGFPAVFVAVVGEMAASPSGAHEANAIIARLVGMARGEGCEHDDDDTVRTHALNILCAVVRCSRLEGVARTLVPTATELALHGFGDGRFGIRNSSLQLFTAVQFRIAVKRVRDEHADENKSTFRAFFSLYPDMYRLLSAQLPLDGDCGGSEANNDGHNQATFSNHLRYFPALVMLSRLRVVDESVSDLAALRARAELCCASPMWKVRVLAARVVATLTEPESALEVVRNALAMPLHGNSGHGTALIVRYIVEAVCDRDRGMPDAIAMLSKALVAALRPGPHRCCPICCEISAALECALPREVTADVVDSMAYTTLATDIHAAVLGLSAAAARAEPYREMLVAQLVSLATTLLFRVTASSTTKTNTAQDGNTASDATDGCAVGVNSDVLAPMTELLAACQLGDVYDGFARAVVAERPRWSPAAAHQLVRVLISPRDFAPDSVESALVALNTLVRGAGKGADLLLVPASGAAERPVGPRAPTTFELNSKWFPKDFCAPREGEGAPVVAGARTLTLGAVLSLVETLFASLGGAPQSLSTAACELLATTLAVVASPARADVARVAAFLGERVSSEPSLRVRREMMRGLAIAASFLGRDLPLEMWLTVLEHAQDDNGEIRWLARLTVDNARCGGPMTGASVLCVGEQSDVTNFADQVSPTSTIVAAFSLLDEMATTVEDKVRFVLTQLLLRDDDGGDAADGDVHVHASDNDDGNDDIAGSEEPPQPCLATEPTTVLLHAHEFLASVGEHPSDSLTETMSSLVAEHLVSTMTRLSAAIASLSKVDTFEARRRCDGSLGILLLRLAPAAAILCNWGRITGVTASLDATLAVPDMAFLDGTTSAPWSPSVSTHLATVLQCAGSREK